MCVGSVLRGELVGVWAVCYVVRGGGVGGRNEVHCMLQKCMLHGACHIVCAACCIVHSSTTLVCHYS